MKLKTVLRIYHLEIADEQINTEKRVRIRSYSGPHFPAFGLNTERYGVTYPVQMRTR